MPPETHVGYRERTTLDITDLDASGRENVDPTAITGVEDYHTVRVIGQEDPSYAFTWNHVDGALDVRSVSDGTEPASGTDVGEVKLEVEGRR